MLLRASFLLFILPISAWANNAFCHDTLAPLDMAFENLPEMTLIEQGTAHGAAFEDGFLNVEVRLGTDAQDLTAQLEDTAQFVQTKTSECRSITANCLVTPLATRNVMGYKLWTRHSGMQQLQWRVPMNGVLMDLRITTNLPDFAALERAGDQAWTKITDQMLKPC